jgi:hypothetical protein
LGLDDDNPSVYPLSRGDVAITPTAIMPEMKLRRFIERL